jgi:hypothetical protein
MAQKRRIPLKEGFSAVEACINGAGRSHVALGELVSQ